MKNYGKDINQNCAGISLNTPRYREIIRPLSKWVPNDAINTNGTFQKNQQQLFLFQLPASWGVVYFPYHWKILRQYYEWRTRRENENLENVVPLSETNNWNRSWKKYLVELMFMNGWYLIYPNFLNQTSLTTHHREQGEHTEAVAESPLLDTLSNVSIDFFTTPLLLDDEVGRDQLNQISIKIKPIEKLPVISFYHNLVSDISSLAALGLYTAQLAEMRGYKSQKYAFENCLPDNFFPIKRIKYKEKYLLYLPIGNLSRQLDAYLNALSFAKTLNRILLVPPLIFREKQTSCPLYSLIDPSKSTKRMTWEEFSNQAVMKPQLDRIISYESAQSPNENDMFDKILLNTYGWKKLGLKLGFLVHSGELQSILKNYDSCTDEILAFWQMHTVFDSYNYNLRDWLSSNPETISFIHANIFREEGKPIICIKAKTMTSLYSMRLAINLDENIVHHVGDYAAINLLVIKVRKNFKTLDVIPDNQLGIFLEENMCIHADYYKSDEPESEDRIALHRISKESK